MKTIELYEPALCCSTGVCGPQVDPVLVRITADLRGLQSRGVCVNRFNLGQNPTAFVLNKVVRTELNQGGPAVLPLVLVDGVLQTRGRYPDRAELEAWCLADATAPVAAATPPEASQSSPE